MEAVLARGDVQWGVVVASIRCMANVNLLHKICGLMIANFRLIVGGDLILYIGDTIEESELTEWRLFIESPWRLEGPTGPLAGSLDFPENGEDPEPWLGVLRPMIGREVLQVTVASGALDITLLLDGNYVIRTFCHTVDGQHWEIRHSSGLREAAGNMTECHRWKEQPDK